MVNASPNSQPAQSQQTQGQKAPAASQDVLQPIEGQPVAPQATQGQAQPVSNGQAPQNNSSANGKANAKEASEKTAPTAQEQVPANGTDAAATVKNELSEFLIEEEEGKTKTYKKAAQADESVDQKLASGEEIFAKALQKVQPAGGEETALPDIEPAAGEVAAPAGGGYGFQSQFAPTAIGPLNALGALGATALNYNAPIIPNPSLIIPNDPNNNPQLVGLPAVVVDETDLNGSIVKNGTIGVDFGSDGPGTITPAGTFTTSGSMTNGTLSSHGVPVVITPTADGYVGTAGGTTVFTLTINPSTGDYVFTLLQPVDHADGNDANDVITINFDIVATDRDGDTAITSLPVNILDDVPLAAAPSNIIDETTDIGNAIGGKVLVDFGADGSGTITADGSFDVSGSFGAQLTSHGVNVVVTPTANGYTGTANGVTVFTFGINPATGDYTFTLLEPLDHADGTNPDDAINLNFGIKVTDFDGDSDNGAVTITVKDDAPIAAAGPAATVDETGLRIDGTESVSGNISVDFGEDGPATTNAITVNGQTSVGGSLKNGTLTSKGVPVVITQTADGYVGKAGATEVFKIVINPNTGAYTFTLTGSLDHADPNNPNDIITLNFGINAKDFDGDTTATSIQINVLDDSPVVVAPENTVDETDLGPVSTNGVVVADLGADGGSIAFNGQFTSTGSKAGGNLTSDGVPVVVTQTANGFEGKANGVTIFTLTLNPATSAYVFTLNGVLDHADGSNPNDVIDLNFGVTVTDGDGSTSTSSIIIHVVDDAPIAFDDGGSVATPDQVITGNVTDNDTIGNDGNPDPVINVNFKGTNYAVTPGANATIVGDFGVLVIDSKGNYTYTPKGNVEGTDQFQYTIQDGDSDTDSATAFLSLGVDGVPIIVNGPISAVDETDFNPTQTVTGQIEADFGADGPGSIGPSGANTFSFSGSVLNNTLTSQGQAVTVTLVGDTYVGKRTDGSDVFTLKINNDGSYSFTAIKPLDHADPNNPDDRLTLKFGVDVVDGDGDKAVTDITIHWDDDAPGVEVPVGTVDETNLDPATTTSGVVNTSFGVEQVTLSINGQFTSSGSKTGGNLTSDGVPVVVTQTANGYVGKAGGVDVFTLSLNTATGQYVFTLLKTLDHADGTNPDDVITLSFGVTATDTDGETGTANINIRVLDDAPQAFDDGGQTANPNEVIAGNVTDNDLVGNDGNNDPVINVNFKGINHAVIPGVNTTIVGDFGTLVINSKGEYTYTPKGNVEGTDQFQYTIQDGDGDTDSATAFLSIGVDGVPVIINGPVSAVDETDFNPSQTVTGEIEVDFGVDGPGSITPLSAASFSFSGSAKNGALTSLGQPVTVTVAGDTYTGKRTDGTTVFTLKINNDGTYVFTALQPLDHASTTNPNDRIEMEFGVKATDADGDSINTDIIIRWDDDGPVAVNDVISLAENQTVATGNVLLNDDVGTDVNPNAVVSVRFNGQDFPVVVGTETVVNGQFGTLRISSNGAFTYTSKNTGAGTDNFSYTIVDRDGDPATANLGVSVTDTDDIPQIIQPAVQTVDETNLNPTTAVSGTVVATYGDDGPGTITPNGNVVGNLTSGGVPVTVTATANGYVGTANGQPIFTLTINPTTGAYTFTLQGVVDHPNTNDPNDVRSINFGVKATDADGDTAATVIAINILDDGPVAANDTISVNEDATEPARGNVLANDNVGKDTNADAVISVRFNGVDYPVTPTTTAQVFGTHGKLIINSKGGFTYMPYSNAQEGTDVFTYTIRDRDGDTATAQLSAVVTDSDDIPQIIMPAVQVVDETNLNPTTAVSGTVVATYGDDGPGAITPNGTFNLNGLTSQGQPITVTATANGYVGTSHGATIFTLTINPSTGAYTFTLQGTVDHPNTNDPNDGVNISFGVKATDADGDTASTTIGITILDDGPVINDAVLGSLDETNLNGGTLNLTGTIAGNFGKDGPGAITTNNSFTATGSVANNKLTSNGVDVVVTQTADGYVGRAGAKDIFKLTINATTGAYVFTLMDTLDHADKTNPNDIIKLNFGVKITDRDGDSDPGVITVDILDDGPVFTSGNPSPITSALDETGLRPDGVESVSNKLNADFGEDGGTISFNNSVNLNGLTSNGLAVTAALQGNKYVGTRADGVKVFEITLASDGNYTFTQFVAVDHADATNPNDIRSVNFGVTATDADGDTATTTITVNIADDGPTAVNDGTKTVTNTTPITGNVVANDTIGADATSTPLTKVTFKGVDYSVPAAGNRVIVGDYGTLTIESDGDYSYVSKNAASGVDNFTYTIADRDGDTATATFAFDVKGAPPPSVDVAVNNNVDDVIVKEDGSVFVKVVANSTNAVAGDVITLTLTGVQPGWNFSGTGWTATGNAGEYKLTLPANQFSYDGGFTFRPPAQSDVDMNNLKVTAVLTRGAITASDSDTFNVITDAVVDPATLTITDRDYSVSYGDRDKKPNGDTILSLNGIAAKQTQDLDGSQVITKIVFDFNQRFKYMDKPEGRNGEIDQSKDTPEHMGWRLNKGTEVSPGVWEILVGDNDATDELANLKIIMPREYLDSVKINGVWYAPPGYHYWEEAKIKITVHTEEINLSGREVDYTDNKAVTSDEIVIKFKVTPLVLDLDGDGIELTSAENGVHFDMLNNDGVKEKTGWVDKDDALLALDKNKDGVINNLSELFGDNNGEHDHGFANLTSYDSNHDGIIDANDAIWNDLIVWQDINHDGISDANEMLTLDEVGIAGIRLNAAETDYFVEGNWVGYESTFINKDGTEGKIADVWFELGGDDVVDQQSDVQDAINDFVAQGDPAQVQDTDVYPVTPSVADVLEDKKPDQSVIV